MINGLKSTTKYIDDEYSMSKKELYKISSKAHKIHYFSSIFSLSLFFVCVCVHCLPKASAWQNVQIN